MTTPPLERHPDFGTTNVEFYGGSCVVCDTREHDGDGWHPVADPGIGAESGGRAGYACSPDCAAIVGKPLAQRRRDVPNARELLTRQFDR